MSARRNLAFVRAGGKSLHTTWLVDDPLRNWDCHVSFYEPGLTCPLAESQSSGGTNKFDGFARYVEGDPLVLSRYDYFFLVDDDLRFSPGGISLFFDACHDLMADLAQPSLSWSCFWTFPVTVQNPMTTARRTNFVEVMMPCFSAAFLRTALSTFRLCVSSWGLEYAWQHQARDRFRCFVVDSIVADHSKAIDLDRGAFYAYMQSLGCDPRDDLAMLQRMFAPIQDPATAPSGHRFRWPALRILNPPLLTLVERLKWRRGLRKLLATSQPPSARGPAR